MRNIDRCLSISNVIFVNKLANFAILENNNFIYFKKHFFTLSISMFLLCFIDFSIT